MHAFARAYGCTCCLQILRRLRAAGPPKSPCSQAEDGYYVRGQCLMSITTMYTLKVRQGRALPRRVFVSGEGAGALCTLLAAQ